MESTRKLRRELTYEVAKLNGLQPSGDLTVDDASTKALAIEIRKQAGICLDLLDQYQSSLPGRMWFYAESKCQPLREDLKRTEMHFREVWVNSSAALREGLTVIPLASGDGMTSTRSKTASIVQILVLAMSRRNRM